MEQIQDKRPYNRIYSVCSSDFVKLGLHYQFYRATFKMGNFTVLQHDYLVSNFVRPNHTYKLPCSSKCIIVRIHHANIVLVFCEE